MELQQLRSTGDTVLIHMPKRSIDTLTVGGKELWFDPTWQEHQHKNLLGLVVAAPAQLGDGYLLSRKGFTPGRVTVSAIQDELRVGDWVYVDWSVSESHLELPGVGGVYRATPNQVVARVREGGVLEPYASYVLLREVWPDDVEEVSMPGVAGKLRLRVSKSGLTMGTEDVPPLPWQGVVAHVGLPLKGQPRRVTVGDRVLIDKAVCDADKRPLKMMLEGEEYLCVRQDYIHAVLEEAAPPAPAFVTECCHADSYNVGDDLNNRDYCCGCGQVAHMVPFREVTRKQAA